MNTHQLIGRSSLNNARNNKWFENTHKHFQNTDSRNDKYFELFENPESEIPTFTYSSNEIELVILGSPYALGSHEPWGTTRAEKLVQPIIQSGPSVLASIGGRFALAAYLRQKHELILAVDRFSIECLFYVIDENEVCFANNTSTLASHDHVKNHFLTQSIYNYLYFHCIPGPDTGFKNIARLLPGQFLHVKNDSITIADYWTPDYRIARSKPQPETLEHALVSSVENRMAAQPVACFLSGGLDSSTLAGICHRVRPQDLTAVTIGFDEEKYDETEYASKAAAHFGIKHETYNMVPSDIVDSLSDICASFNTPFGNASALPTYYCAKLAKDLGCTHMLAGDGGDELFGGNSRYSKELVFDLYRRIPSLARSSMLEPAISILNQLLPNKLSRKAQSYIEQANIPLPERTQTYNLMNRVSSDEFLSTDFLASINKRTPLDQLEDIYFTEPVPEHVINRMLKLDWRLTLADNDLVKVTKMCELAHTYVEFPMLDESVFSLACSLEPKEKVTINDLRPFYRKAFEHMLPKSTLEKSKHGFGLPFGLWLEKNPALKELAFDALRYLVDSQVLDKRSSADYFQRKLREHPDYYGVLVWVLMCLSFWLKSRKVTIS